MWGFIDRSGRFVITPLFEKNYPFKGVLLRVKNNGNYGFIESPLSNDSAGEAPGKGSRLTGEVKSAGKEIIVGGEDIASRVYMGDSLVIFSGADHKKMYFIIRESVFVCRNVNQ